MAITAGELSVLLTAKDQMSKVLKQVQGETEKTEGVLNKLAKGLAVGVVGAAAAAGAAVVGMGTAIAKMAMDAAPLEGVKKAFEGITEASGQSGAAVLSALETGSAGMVRQTDLMKSYNQAAQLVSVDFANKLPQAMGYLGKVSAATGQDMGFLLDSLVKGVGRLSPMILDNLAIQVNATEANEAYAASVGKSATELTKQEQQTAMMNMVLQKLAENTAAMPEVAGSAAASMAALGVQVQNAKDRIGLAFLPVLTQLLATLTPIATTILASLIPAFIQLIPVVSSFVSWLQTGLFPAISAVINFIQSNAIPIIAGLGAGLIALVVTVIPALVAAFTAWAATAGVAAAATMAALAPIVLPIVAIGVAVGLLAAAWQNDWGGIRTTLTEVWESSVRPALEALWQFISVTLPDGVTALWNSWVERWQGIQDAVATAWTNIQNFINTALDTIKSTISGFSLADVGRGLVDGLRGGIEGAANSVADAARSIVQNAINAAKEALGIKSPSKIFYEIGDYMMIGLKDGIDENKVKAVQSVASVAQSMASIGQSLAGIGGYKGGGAKITEGISSIIADLGSVFKFIRVEFAKYNEDARKVLETSAQSAGFISSMIGAVAQIAGALATIAEYGKTAAESSKFLQTGIDWLYVNTKAALGMLQVLAPAWGDVAGEYKLASANIGECVAPLSNMVGAVATVSEYGKDAAEKSKWLQPGIDWLYVNTIAALGMLQVLAPKWREVAAKIKEATRDIGEALSPLSNMVTAIKSVADFGKDAAKQAAQIQPGLDWLYVNTLAALGMLQVLAPRFGEIAGKIKEATKNIGEALAPLSSMVTAIKATAEYGKKAAEESQYLQRGIDWLFTNTIAAMGMLVVLAPRLADAAKASKDALADIANAMQSFSGIINSVASAVKTLVTDQEYLLGVAAAWKIEDIEAMLTNVFVKWATGMMNAFEKLRALGFDAEGNDPIGKNLSAWASRLQSIAGIVGSVSQAVKVLVDSQDYLMGVAGAWKVEDITKVFTNTIVKWATGLMAAFEQLATFGFVGAGKDGGAGQDTVSQNLTGWASRLQAIAGIIGSVASAIKVLVDEQDYLLGVAASWKVEDIARVFSNTIVKWATGLMAAFDSLATLGFVGEGKDGAAGQDIVSQSLTGWAARLQSIAGIIGSVTSAVKTLVDEQGYLLGVAQAWTVEDIQRVFENTIVKWAKGLMAAFKTLGTLGFVGEGENGGAGQDEISQNLTGWAARLTSIAGIIGSVTNAVKMLVDEQKYLLGVAQHWTVEDIQQVFTNTIVKWATGLMRAFKDLATLGFVGKGKDGGAGQDPIAQNLEGWAGRLTSIASIIGSVTSAIKTLVDEQDYLLGVSQHWNVEDIQKVFENTIVKWAKGLMAAFKDLGTLGFIGKKDANGDPLEDLIGQNLEGWAQRMGSIAGIFGSMMDIISTKWSEYKSPNLGVVNTMIRDMQMLGDQISLALAELLGSAKDIEAKTKPLTAGEGYAGAISGILGSVLAATDALRELSWRKITQGQVDSFIANARSLFVWLADPETGLPSLGDLPEFAMQTNAISNITGMTTDLVDAFRAIGTLPQNIFPQARWDQLNIAISSLVTALKIAAQANIAPLFKIGASMGEAIIAGLNFALSSGGMALSPGLALPTGGGMTITHNVNVTVKVEGGMVIASDADRTSFARQITPAIMSELNRGGYGTATDPNAWRPPHR